MVTQGVGARATTANLLPYLAAATPASGSPPAVTGPLRRAAIEHGIAPLVYVRGRQWGASGTDGLRPHYQQAVGNHLRTRSALPELAAQLDDAAPTWVLVKGPVLSEIAHPVPGVRPYADLDILVDPVDFPAVVADLRDAGWELLDRNHPLLRDARPGEVHFARAGTQLDLHWSPFNMADTRSGFPDGMRQALRARRRLMVGRHGVWTLSPADLLVHTALHAALSGADRLLALVDVDGLVRRGDVHPTALRDRAHAWGAGPAMALVLWRCTRWLGTAVPEDLLHALGGRGAWRLACSLVDRRFCVPSGRPGRGVPRLIARASRPTPQGSVVETGRRVTRHAAQKLSSPTGDSVFRDNPDEDALRGYLKWVATKGAGHGRVP